MKLTLYSWNVLCDNDPARAFAFISTLDFDVLFLQEVTPALLERLRTLPWHVAASEESNREYPNGETELNYSVVLSRHPLLEHGTLMLPPFEKPLRGRIFSWLMRWSFGAQRRALYADISLGDRTVRTVCVHLTLSHPEQRLREFDALIQQTLPSDRPAIIAGDFNVLESWRILFLNWVQGGRFMESFARRRERARLQERFAAYGLDNPLNRRSTHPVSGSQLDHILLSRDFRVEDVQVLKNRHGSDHRPVRVEAYLLEA